MLSVSTIDDTARRVSTVSQSINVGGMKIFDNIVDTPNT